jgi:hypothetical protein
MPPPSTRKKARHPELVDQSRCPVKGVPTRKMTKILTGKHEIMKKMRKAFLNFVWVHSPPLAARSG